ncbi:tryptophan halogenase family protein [Shewanella intestini]|uniref:Tryptophan 7-halogenase n=1 Tax=Shewanella intestini TaxID=2017544 RepID=A0ABS5HZC0_9GAMM|nr:MULTISPECIES: tryptophan halogenase family protein [Shewanella]MBR9727134.1 tryptophan 7-halogenase [Shewanella intestini]MRG35936.1 tryptophan halogenase [Shewanella sp. XMDDZSB0408]
MNNNINNIVIVGGGTSGWMTAALLSKMYSQTLNISLIESADISTIGVGEATIPPLKIFNDVLGVDEKSFIAQTHASIKLGIEFSHWGKESQCYMHAFGTLGKNIGYTSFHHYWLASKPETASSLWDFSFNYQAASAGKFANVTRIHNEQLAGLTHAYHFDAGRYAQLLQQLCSNAGITHIQDTVNDVVLDEQGNIARLHLNASPPIEGDLFIDFSGQTGLLIDKALGVEFDSYQKWLKCDRAWAVASEASHPIIPFTRAIAHEFGWQWRIPLQHRTGNGLVYSSQFIDDDSAKQRLLSNLDTKAITQPRLLKFTPGRRVKQWHKNCVAIGLSSGFLEPLESTSLHLVQTAIIRLTKLLPHRRITPALVDEYNRQSQREFEQIRDFIILHYALNQRQSGDLWQQCRQMSLPESLRQKIDLFAQSGNLFRQQDELFTEEAWLQVMIGQGLMPSDHNPLANNMTAIQRDEFLSNLKAIYQHYCAQLPPHEQFLQR